MDGHGNETYLPRGAGTAGRPGGLRVVSGTRSWPVLRAWDDGFAIAPGQRIRGFVDIFDGERHVSSCLATAAGIENGEALYVIKRRNPIRAVSPCDYAAETGSPTGALAAFEASRVGL